MVLEEFFQNQRIVLNQAQQEVAKELSKRLKMQRKLYLFASEKKCIYLWGDVGRGKTMLMDGFFSNLKTKALRVHYHQFFKDLYKDLKGATQQKKELKKIASEVAKKYQVICFDEFHLHDVANTVLMEVFLNVLIKKKVQVVLTSNYQPDQLLPDPTMHVHALPLIDSIKKNFKVLNLIGKKDYRYEISIGNEKNDSFIYPNNSQAIRRLKQIILDGSKTDQELKEGEIDFSMGSTVSVEMMNQDSIWFTLDNICGGNYSHLDYLEITEKWKKVVLIDINQEGLEHPATLRRFVWLIDIFYDQKIQLYIISEDDIIKMLSKIPDFADLSRTISRLTEMQSL